MTRKILAILVLLVICVNLLPTVALAAGDVAINATHFPDANFRSYVRANFDADKNGILSVAEQRAVTEIDISNCDISDLTGLWYFTNTEILDCSDNVNIRELFIGPNVYTNMPNLTKLDLSGTNIYRMTLSGAPNLTWLDCSGVWMEKLPDLEDLKALTYLACNFCKNLRELDLTNQTKLTYVSCYYSALETVNLSNNPELSELVIYGNQLTQLDVSKNPKLTKLSCYNNPLTSLDLGSNPALTKFNSGTWEPVYLPYDIMLSPDRTFDLSVLPGSFDVTRSGNWAGGSVDGTVLTADAGVSQVTYTYDCGNGITAEFILRLSEHIHTFDRELPEADYAACPASCTEPGAYYLSCQCGERGTETFFWGEALGHSYTDVITAPTCTEKGYTTHTCHCGDSYVDSYTDALGHSYGDWTVTKDATCTEAGTERRDCERCDQYEIRETDATGHSYTAVITAPTCMEKGYTTHTCHCGDSYVDSYTDALGHDYGNWVVIEDATCTENGTERRDCERCDQYETQEIAAKGHSYTDVITAPTCTEKGYTTHTCHCGDSYVDSYTDALGHRYTYSVSTAPTLTAEGSLAGFCGTCGDRVQVTVPALNETDYTVEDGKYVWKDGTYGVFAFDIPADHLAGDINGDSSVNNKDVTRLFQYLSGYDVEVVVPALDVNNDGNVNNKDLTRLFQYLSGYDVEIF